MTDPLEDLAKGAVEGFLNFTKENIVELAQRLQNRDIAFIKDPENIQAVKKERNSAEYKFIKDYLKREDDFAILIQMGLTLRSIRSQKENRQKISDLCSKIQGQYGIAGLHIAELTEHGLVTELLTRLLQMYTVIADVQTKLSSFLHQSEKLAIFVRVENKEKDIIHSVDIRLETLSFPVVILVSVGEPVRKLRRIVESLREKRYAIELDEKGEQLTAFIYSPEARAEVDHWTQLVTEDVMRRKKKSDK